MTFATFRERWALRRQPGIVKASAFLVEALEPRRFLSADVLTYHNDNGRTGQDLTETTLTPGNVNSSAFGKLFSYSIDGFAYAQPLYVSNLAIDGGTHNVVFVATEHDSVYAFDADSNSGSNSAPLWHDSFINPAAGITTVSASDVSSEDLSEIGITSTPVIDRGTNTLYVVAKTKENGTYVQRLHALDLSTGAEKFGGPVTIQFSTPGNGDGNDGNGHIPFDPLTQNQRSGLALVNGVVYIAWASHGDIGPYHGLVAGYDASTLQLVSALNVTPNGSEGGIWMSGAAPAVDDQGNLYLMTGNGSFDSNVDFGDSFLKISTAGGLAIADSFTPFNQDVLANADLDLGSGGVVLLPDQPGSDIHELIGGGKEGNAYVVDRDALGGFSASANTNVQTLLVGTNDGNGGLYDTPAYFNNTVYLNPQNQGVEAFALSNGQLTGPSSASSAQFAFPGSTPSISANGNTNGIVWETEYGPHAVLHAYDASNVGTELYNSDQNGSRDQLGAGVKFSVPTIANGHVYVGTSTTLTVFGPLAPAQDITPAAPSGLTASVVSPTDIRLNWSVNSTNATSFVIDRSTDGMNFTTIGTASGTSDTFDDLTAVVGTAYTYRVHAVNSAGASDFSNLAIPTVTPIATGTISGNVFDDANGNGGLDPGEMGAGGVAVFLDSNGNGSPDIGEASVITDSAGNYTFTDLADGVYRVVAVPTDDFRLTTPQAGFAQITVQRGQSISGVNFGQTLKAQPPVVSQFDVSFASSLPGAVVGGANRTVTIRAANATAATISGPLQIKLFCSADTTLESDATLVTSLNTPVITLRPGRGKTFRVRFNFPSSLPAGNYFLLGAVTSGGDGSGRSVAVSPAPITIAAPFIDLRPTFAAAPLASAGHDTTATITITNLGNADASGTATIDLFESPDSLPKDGQASLATLNTRLGIRAGRSKAFRIRFVAPQGLPGGSYFVVASLNSVTQPADNNSANDVAVTPTRPPG